MVTASHNPADYNGLKLVREDARPISGDTGLEDIRVLAERDRAVHGCDSLALGHRRMFSMTTSIIS